MRFFLHLALALVLTVPLHAQEEKDTNGLNVSAGPRKQVATVIYAGLAGAVLGLSTLSFHGRPQDHLDSIAGGFALGIIVGAIVSSYGVATDPTRLNSLHTQPVEPEYVSRTGTNNQPIMLSHSWTF